MKKYLFLFFLLSVFYGKAQKDTLIFFKENKVHPVLLLPSTNETILNAVQFFNRKSTSIFGKEIEISNSICTNSTAITFVLSRSIKYDGFKIVSTLKSIQIYAATKMGFQLGVEAFFKNVLVENNLTYFFVTGVVLDEPDFEYREVYFSNNFKPKNRLEFKTHSLDDEWGLWGHNIHKWVKKVPHSKAIFALVGGVRNEEQFCFSSDELQVIVQNKLKESLQNNSAAKKFIIAPSDTGLVCQCKSCLAAGNTKSNASPAVFKLLSYFAKSYPSLEFWTLGYVSTRTPPEEKMASNVGVLISTIDCQEGLPLTTTSKGNKFLELLKAWRSKITKIYIWDYVVNFDNYFDAYPILYASKENLKTYKNLGVEGVFMQGSGEDYSLLQTVKFETLAKLLWNVNASVEEGVVNSIEEKYPSIKSLLLNWYLSIEKQGIISGKRQSIYSGIHRAEKKYLNLADLQLLIDKISKYKYLNFDEKQVYYQLIFLELELQRTKGVVFWNKFPKENKKSVLNERLSNLLSLLNKAQQKNEIPNTINEQMYTITDYIKEWQFLENRIPSNLLTDKIDLKISTKTKLDEDYSAIKVLQDKVFGFTDYNNNWLIYSGQELALQLKTKNWSTVKYIRMSFLSDEKHKIHLPEKLKILVNQKELKIIEVAMSSSKQGAKFIREVKVPVAINENVEQITLSIFNAKKSIACDEIYLSNE